VGFETEIPEHLLLADGICRTECGYKGCIATCRFSLYASHIVCNCTSAAVIIVALIRNKPLVRACGISISRRSCCFEGTTVRSKLESDLSSPLQAFVTLVVCLTSSVVVLFYMNVLPHVLKTHSTFCAHVHLAYGHYLLLMIVFHYFKAVTTNPGCPPAVSKDCLHANVICKSGSAS